MPCNLEVKARIRSIHAAEQIARSFGATFEGYLHQVDTYFNVKQGRLKSREINRDRAELIYYERDERSERRESNYTVYPCSDIPLLKQVLEASLGIRVIVRKKRSLFMYHSTRIHLDEVEHLGTFLEVESPLEESLDKAQEIVAFLVKKFDIKNSDYVLQSYADLLTATSSEP